MSRHLRGAQSSRPANWVRMSTVSRAPWTRVQKRGVGGFHFQRRRAPLDRRREPSRRFPAGARSAAPELRLPPRARTARSLAWAQAARRSSSIWTRRVGGAGQGPLVPRPPGHFVRPQRRATAPRPRGVLMDGFVHGSVGVVPTGPSEELQRGAATRSNRRRGFASRPRGPAPTCNSGASASNARRPPV